MPAPALSPSQSVTVVLRDLVASLEEEDPRAREAAEAAWKVWTDVEARNGREPSEIDRAHSLASAHQSLCQKGRNAECVGCALSKAILFCCMVDDEKHVHDFASVVGSAMRGLVAIRLRLEPALQRFRDAEAPIIRMRRERLLPEERRRRSVALRVGLALNVPVRLLREVPEILHQEDVYKGMRESASSTVMLA